MPSAIGMRSCFIGFWLDNFIKPKHSYQEQPHRDCQEALFTIEAHCDGEFNYSPLLSNHFHWTNLVKIENSFLRWFRVIHFSWSYLQVIMRYFPKSWKNLRPIVEPIFSTTTYNGRPNWPTLNSSKRGKEIPPMGSRTQVAFDNLTFGKLFKTGRKSIYFFYWDRSENPNCIHSSFAKRLPTFSQEIRIILEEVKEIHFRKKQTQV